MSRSPISTLPIDPPVTRNSPNSFNPDGLTISLSNLTATPLDRDFDRDIQDWMTRLSLLGRGKIPVFSKIEEIPLSIFLKISLASISPRVSSHPQTRIPFSLEKPNRFIPIPILTPLPSSFEDSTRTPPHLLSFSVKDIVRPLHFCFQNRGNHSSNTSLDNSRRELVN